MRIGNIRNYFLSGRGASHPHRAARRQNSSKRFSRRGFEWLEPRQMLTIALPTYTAGTETLSFAGTSNSDTLTLSIVTQPMSTLNSIKYNVNGVDMVQDNVAHVTFDGGGGAGSDTLIINGLSTPSNTFKFTGSTVTASSASATMSVDFAFSDGVNLLVVNGGTSGDTFNVQSTTVETHILGGLGNDTVNVCSDAGNGTGNQGNLEGIGGPLDVDLGVGANSMIVSDFGETTLLNANTDVVVEFGDIFNFAGPTNNNFIAFTDTGGTLGLTLLGSNTLADDFIVNDIASNVSLSLLGEGGDSTFVIGTGNLSFIASPVTVIAGSGTNDQLTVDDSGRSTAINYSVTSQVDVGGTAVVESFVGVDKLQLNGTQGINQFNVTPSATTAININGEDPSTSPGDSLFVNLAGTTDAKLTPAGPGAGQWIFASNNPMPVTYTNIENSSIGDLLAYGAAASVTSQPIVKIVDATTGTSIGLSPIQAYATNYRGGVHVALGDVNSDGIPELITTPGRNLAATVEVFNLLSLLGGTTTPLETFNAFPDIKKFSQGLNVAVGDVNGDGKDDLVVVPTVGKAEVRVFLNTGNPSAPFSTTPSQRFLAFGPKYVSGATVAVGDIQGLTNATTHLPMDDIIIGSGPGTAPQVLVFSGNTNTTTNTKVALTAAATAALKFTPFNSFFRGGVDVAAAANGQVSQNVGKIIVGAGVFGGSLEETLTRSGSTFTVSNVHEAFSGSNDPLQIAVNSTDLAQAEVKNVPLTPLIQLDILPPISEPMNVDFAGGFSIALDADL